MSIRAIVQRHGGPEVIEFVGDETAAAPPGHGEVRLRHRAIGFNLIDTYHRSGLYPLKLPTGLGMEAAGEVIACGPGVEDFAPGDRVAYAGGALRAYSHERLIEASHLVRLPPDVDDELAAAVLLKGMTVHYLLTRTFEVRAGHVLLVHAAAGGVGSLLVPWAKHLGATVIGCARGGEKQAAARASGCDHVLDAEDADFVATVRALTGGTGVDVAYDSVGRATFDASLSCLRRRGMLVSYGNASGKPPAIEPTRLAAMGSLFLTRPILGDYIATRAELDATAGAVFDALRRGVIRAEVRQRYPLLEARRAHEELESRGLRGLSVLLP
jgi:NADPH2:quinone reductase